MTDPAPPLIPAPEDSAAGPAVVRVRGWWRALRWGQRVVVALALLLGLLAAGFVVLDSSLGHRLVVDRIAALTPGSGLRIRIGRIDGSLYGAAQLHDVVLSDPQGRFMTIPEAELDWRPLSWLRSGLDIRQLVLHRGTLLRSPRFNPGDPNAPTLPNYDIRIDRFVIDNLTVARGVAGAARRVDVTARADIRHGRALLDLTGRLGGRDRLVVHLDSEPDRDRFDLALDYNAPRDGLLAALSGIRRDVVARVGGRGRFAEWHGHAWAAQDGRKLAAFLIDNRDGRYGVAGQVFPDGLLRGTAAAAVGDRLSLTYDGTFAASRLDGALRARGAAFLAAADGRLDLANNRADDLTFKALLTRPDRVLDPRGALRVDGLRLSGEANGRFSDLSVPYTLTAAELRSGTMVARGLRSAGTLRWDGQTLRLPVDLTAAQVRTGQPQLDPRFAGGSVQGDLLLRGSALSAPGIAVNLRGLAARLVLKGDIARGGYALAGPVTARGFALPNLGQVNADAKIVFRIGQGVPWALQANVAGRMTRIDNATLVSLAGGNVRFAGGVTVGQAIPLTFRKARLTATKLDLALDGRVAADGRTSVVGSGRHADYGAFTVDAAMGRDGPHAVLVFASPLPAAGLKDVRVALDPAPGGFVIDTKGQSRLGPFAALFDLAMPPGGPVRIAIRQGAVSDTRLTGAVTLANGGVTGDVALTGGGLDGAVHLEPRSGGPGEGGQAITVKLAARDAHFAGPMPVMVGRADVTVDALVADNVTVDAHVEAQGLASGSLFIGRMAADATIINGSGSVTASLAGRRGTQFALQGTAAFAPDKVIAFVAGDYAGRSIAMPRRAVIEREGTGTGWRLNPTQVDFGSGSIIADGRFGGAATELHLAVSRMPLSVVDIVVANLGLGGLASGIVDYRDDGTGAPTGHAALQVKGLSRSGLVLTSRPLDLALVVSLDAASLQARAVMKEGVAMRGRLQALVADLPRGGSVTDRLRAGRVQAQVRYSGPADALWRLAAIEVFDLTGPLGAAADIAGTLDHPVIGGAIASRALRVQSALTGSDVRNVDVTGSFADSRLSLSRFAGTTPNGGRVTGSGTIDLSDLTQGVGIDLRLAAANAELINRPDMGATVTGPLRVVAGPAGGTVAGRVRIDQARWQLGRAAAATALPTIPTTEVNARADIAPPRRKAAPWHYLIDASAPNRIAVRGLGLDSEWGGDIRLRGDTSNPQIFGDVEVVRGGYEFAGKRFELTRGKIRFTGEVPVDPRLDILAEGDANGVSAKIAITGSATKASISFTSIPALPEEELLSRLLFGSSITQISAPEALQLASAVASLRGGGGLDPINKLRSAIGLDRLRIVGADATTGRGTSIAVGKYLGRRFFVELVTDGRGYSATSVEFRITRWLALLGTLSTIGDESLNLKASKDY